MKNLKKWKWNWNVHNWTLTIKIDLRVVLRFVVLLALLAVSLFAAYWAVLGIIALIKWAKWWLLVGVAAIAIIWFLARFGFFVWLCKQMTKNLKQQ